LPLLAAAQLTPNTVTVTATRAASLQADEAVLRIVVHAPLEATREEVLAVAAGAGLSASHFSYLTFSGLTGVSPVSWCFLTTVPITDLKARLAALTAMQNALAKDGRFTLSIFLESSDGASQSRPSCSLPDLVSDARAQAAKLASAAGASLGAIQAILGGTAVTQTTSSGIGGSAPASAPICSVTVKFSLGGL
jgi:hypothetical protein